MRRTGIKIFFRKLYYYVTYPYRLFKNNEELFQKKGESYSKIYIWLYTLKNEIKERKLSKQVGFLHCQPHPLAVNVWKSLLPYNPNNMGSWVQAPEKDLTGTTNAENALIMRMTDLLGGNKKVWSGYMTAGASEGNLFAAWVGRNYFKNEESGKKICMIVNPLTHYSVKKAANIIDIQCMEMGIDRHTWTINPDVLKNKVKELSAKGYDSFLIPLTLGYTQTGANDDYKRITGILNKLQKELGIVCFIWLDAAINGLILPFTDPGFSPLETPGINLITLDFHKTGMCPIPSGLVIYKGNLKKYISQKVAYLDQDDATVSGSRSGIPAVACLAIVKKLGKDGFKKLINKVFIKKNGLIKFFKTLSQDIEIFNEKKSLALALVCKKPLPDKVVDKLGIYSKKWEYVFDQKAENLYIYKINFPLEV